MRFSSIDGLSEFEFEEPSWLGDDIEETEIDIDMISDYDIDGMNIIADQDDEGRIVRVFEIRVVDYDEDEEVY